MQHHEKSAKSESQVTIKKYANRRLYDTESSTYVTLEDLCRMVKEDREFTVVDAKSGEDLTRQILTQIILEQELKGVNIMPADFLRGVIKMHDEQIGGVMQSYLDMTMKSFADNQERMRQYVNDSMASFNASAIAPFQQMEELGRQNMEMFNQAMKLFNPFAAMDNKDKK